MPRVVLLIIITFIYKSFAGTDNSWPTNIEPFIKSTCVVEFYQRQSENREIKDRARIKKNLTGILVNKNGLIVTSDEIYPANLDISSGRFSFFHSQQLPEDITIIFEKDKKYKASFVGKDEETKLAFVKVLEPENLPKTITFDTSAVPKIGQPVFLIERLDKKYDFEPILVKKNINSIITKPRQKLLISSTLKTLSDGGLVIDTNGKAIGIIQSDRQKYVYDPENITSQHTLLEVLLANDFIKLIENPPTMTAVKKGIGKSWLGIQMQILKKDMAEYWDLDKTYGLIVNKVVPNSPAEDAELKVGDIITSVGNLKINGEDEKNLAVFRNYVRSLPEGPIDISFIREGKKHTIQIFLRSAPKSQFLAEELPVEELGFSIKELTQDIFMNYNIDFDTEGVWVSRVENAGNANIAGLFVGDIILDVNDFEVKNLNSFRDNIKDVLEDKPDYIQLFILRNNKTLFLYLKNRQEDFSQK